MVMGNTKTKRDDTCKYDEDCYKDGQKCYELDWLSCICKNGKCERTKPGYFGEPSNGECFDDNIAYMGNNIVMGVDNMQPSRDACQKSCQDNPDCDFWTWEKSGPNEGRCYLKDARENITPTDDYMSGSRQCKLPANPVTETPSYEELLTTRAGRHLLLITLFEGISLPISEPRCNGTIIYELPQELSDLSAPINQDYNLNRQAKPTNKNKITCCKLESVPARPVSPLSRNRYSNDPFGNGRNEQQDSITLSNLLTECERKGILSIERFVHANLFDNTQKQYAVDLAEIILSSTTFASVLSIAAAVHDFVNQQLFREALALVILKRDDVGMVLPMSPEFLPLYLNGTGTQIPGPGQKTEVFMDVSWNEPPYQTYATSEEDYNMWYFREDPEINSHHNYWHVVFGDGSNVDRRGEFFFYMHRQMLNRYKVDRLTLGLTPIEPLSPDTWEEPIPLGYFPKMRSISGQPYEGRADNMPLQDLFNPRRNTTTFVSALSEWYQEIEQAIMNMEFSATNGSIIPLLASQGRDEGITILGDFVEPARSLNTGVYGALHNMGHNFIARVSDPRRRHMTSMGVMGNTATSLRDPVFYRWHQFIDDIFSQYKALLPPYTENDLSFPGVEIVTSEVYTNSKRNVLHTFIEQNELLLQGLDFSLNDTVRLRYNRLNHRPFEYKIEVRSRKRVPAKVRIFLMPSETQHDPQPQAIEMDKFLVTLDAGNNVLTRDSTQTPVTGKSQRTLLELQQAIINGITDTDLGQFEGCGWPQPLLVPHGTESSASFVMFVMVSQLLPGDAALSADQDAVAQSSFVYCGLPNGSLIPDSRPMGFPFDRPVRWSWDRMPNTALTDVRIFHSTDDDSSSSTT